VRRERGSASQTPPISGRTPAPSTSGEPVARERFCATARPATGDESHRKSSANVGRGPSNPAVESGGLGTTGIATSRGCQATL
jgi:hypothetical protein